MKTFSGNCKQGGNTHLHKLRILDQAIKACFTVSLAIAVFAFTEFICSENAGYNFWSIIIYPKACLISSDRGVIAKLLPTSELYENEENLAPFINTTISLLYYAVRQDNHLLFFRFKKLLQVPLLLNSTPNKLQNPQIIPEAMVNFSIACGLHLLKICKNNAEFSPISQYIKQNSNTIWTRL